MAIYRAILAILLFCIFSIGAHAKDLEKGTWSVGGNLTATGRFGDRSVSFNTTTSNQQIKAFKMSAKPVYYVFKNIGIGLDLEYQDETRTIETSTTKYNQTGVTIGPTFLYDIALDDNINLRLRGTTGFWLIKSGYSSPTTSDTLEQSGYAAVAEGGFVYFIRNNISADAGVNYTRIVQTSTSSDYKLSVKGAEIFMGATLYF